MSTLAVTCGDINGIGVETALKALKKLDENVFDGKVVFIVPENVYVKARNSFNINLPDFVTLDFIGDAETEAGKPTAESGKTAFAAIKRAYELIENGKAEAMVTAPISKEALALAGVRYKGHTDMLADFAGVREYLMIFVSEKFRTALATIHVPLANVSSLLSREILFSKLELLDRTARNDFSIVSPKIAVLGLNPHAGENGNIGFEEIEKIIPAIKTAREKGMNVEGPFVPDAFFANGNYERYDFVLGMYHDQVLIPFKMLAFDSGVNFTAGLPFVRTSPDHGTAYDIAWRGIANENSMLAALLLADKISRNGNEKG